LRNERTGFTQTAVTIMVTHVPRIEKRDCRLSARKEEILEVKDPRSREFQVETRAICGKFGRSRGTTRVDLLTKGMSEWDGSNDGSGGGVFQDSGSFQSSGTSHSDRSRNPKSIASEPASSNGDDDEYGDDEFDDYESDSFEAEDDAVDADSTPASDTSGSAAWLTGDRVQVFWADEGAWFDGIISNCSGQKFQIQYDDGDVGWEVRFGSNCEAITARIHP